MSDANSLDLLDLGVSQKIGVGLVLAQSRVTTRVALYIWRQSHEILKNQSPDPLLDKPAAPRQNTAYFLITTREEREGSEGSEEKSL